MSIQTTLEVIARVGFRCNASAATYFDVRIPGLQMQVTHADGLPIEPVEVHELRIAVAETYDVIIEPDGAAHTIFAETMDRSGFVCGTLSTDARTTAPMPARREREYLTMMDMGMDHGAMPGMDHRAMGDEATKPAMDHGAMPGMDHGAMGDEATKPTMDHEAIPNIDHGAMGGEAAKPATDHGAMPGMDHSAMGGEPAEPAMDHKTKPMASAYGAALAIVSHHGADEHGAGNTMVAKVASNRVSDPGVGLRDAKWRVLTYADLRRAEPGPAQPDATREIELHLTGNMERYMWSFDGVKYHADMPDIQLKRGERVRFVLINDTMMAHPIHLHGMFFELEVGACERNPFKHTVNAQPGSRTSFTLTAIEVGRWAFHCHILYHMAAGMFRVVKVVA